MINRKFVKMKNTTEREQEILNLLKQKFSLKEISDKLGISVHTVKAYKIAISRKGMNK